MFGRVQSGIFGDRRRRVAPAPQQQERPRSPFPLPLGPPAPPRELPFPDALHGERPPVPVYVHPIYMRNRSIGEQVAQLHENRSAIQQLIPRTNVVVQAPGGQLFDAGQIPSREEASAIRQYEKAMRGRDNLAKGGVIKSYGVGSSSIKDVIVSSRGGAGGGGKQPPKRNPTDIRNEISDIDDELRRLKRERKRLQESNDPGAPALIVEINNAISMLSQRKIKVMRDL